ncbi:hypothetical protein EJ110_NYTH58398 [Nymphaea thermarum]|nr:hypothetical protein EJ110_NYTH58398 [Nymphaea thermarum]
MDRRIERLFFASSLPFNVARSPYWKDVVTEYLVYGTGSGYGPGTHGHENLGVSLSLLGLRFAPRLELLRGFSPLSEVFHVYLVLLLRFLFRCLFLHGIRARACGTHRVTVKFVVVLAPPPSFPLPPPVLSLSLPPSSLPALFPPPSLLPAPPPSLSVLPSSQIALVVSGVGDCLSLEIVMAAEMTPKTDVAFDTGGSPKSENVPVQVTSIRLNKDNYLSWSAALEIGITSRGRLPYITGERPTPSKTDPSWATWALEDSQVKVWIINSVSPSPLVSPVRSAYGARPRVFLCDVLGTLGSRLPKLGVLGKAEYLSLEFTHPWTSALPLQRK